MAVTFPEVRVGDPICCEGLAIFPLFGNGGGDTVPYVLSDEAIASESVTVAEISEGGSVPNLAVDNQGDIRVLFLEGEELIGAKQNRVLNLSLLIAAHSKTPVPVSCVEQGRWGYRGRKFGSGGYSPSTVRHILKRSVAASLSAKTGHRSDQSGVWREVARKQHALGTTSATSAMSDAFIAHEEKIRDYQEKLRPVEGAVGLAVAVGGKVVCLDLFDKPTTCQKVWDRLVSGYVLDALETPASDQKATTNAVADVVAKVGGLPWQPVETIGEGQDYRAEDTALAASALTLDEKLIHASVSLGA